MLALLAVAHLAAPELASAQTVVAPDPQPVPPPPLQLFKEKVPEHGERPIESIKSSSWWEPPRSGSDIPRSAIGQTVVFHASGGFALSAGVFGRRGDPLPLFVSQNVSPAMHEAASDFVRHPSMYRWQWDLKFRVTAPLWNGSKLKMNGLGELFVPLPGATGDSVVFPRSSAPFPPSKATRFGIAMGF